MRAVVIHSGGMDSSTCLKLAIDEFGVENVTALAFNYRQRNINELEAGAKICAEWRVKRKVLDFPVFAEVTQSALLDASLPLESIDSKPYSAWVVGRNGIMFQIGGIFAHHLGADTLWTGVMQRPDSNSGYPDCSQRYVSLKQQALRIDLGNPHFEIRAPLIDMTKAESFALAQRLGILDFLLANTVTCYEGIPEQGCGQCACCVLRNEGLREFLMKK
jgi:7-cyano-7-deazaguanine synthase